MKCFSKVALGALMVVGAATVAVPASAAVVVGIGAPVAVAPAPACNPYSPYYYPYYCGPAYVGGPVIGFGFGGWARRISPPLIKSEMEMAPDSRGHFFFASSFGWFAGRSFAPCVDTSQHGW